MTSTIAAISPILRDPATIRPMWPFRVRRSVGSNSRPRCSESMPLSLSLAVSALFLGRWSSRAMSNAPQSGRAPVGFAQLYEYGKTAPPTNISTGRPIVSSSPPRSGRLALRESSWATVRQLGRGCRLDHCVNAGSRRGRRWFARASPTWRGRTRPYWRTWAFHSRRTGP